MLTLMQPQRIFHEDEFVQMIFPFLLFDIAQRTFLSRLIFNLLDHYEVFVEVFHYRLPEVVS